MRLYKFYAFSLLEILITLSVLGVLVSISYPSLQSLLQSSNRKEATLLLTKIQYQQEQWRSHHQNYALLSELKVPSTSENNLYQIKISLIEDDNYLITAEPINGQLGESCGAYAMDKYGPVEKSSSGKIYANLDCWQY